MPGERARTGSLPRAVSWATDGFGLPPRRHPLQLRVEGSPRSGPCRRTLHGRRGAGSDGRLIPTLPSSAVFNAVLAALPSDHKADDIGAYLASTSWPI